MKRAIDITVAAAILVLAAPILGITALFVWLAMGRPILFRQVRPGRRGRPFTLWKFRTMRQAVGADGRPLPDSQRLTPLGRLLRHTSIDELPQLVNVLRGDMSLIGPRPLLMEYLDRYTPEQARRHEVRPGITGWAQVNGRNALTWEEKFALDVWYVDHWSLALDAKIVWLTVRAVLCRHGVDHAHDVPMPEFLGTPKGGPDSLSIGAAKPQEVIAQRHGEPSGALRHPDSRAIGATHDETLYDISGYPI